MGLYLIKFYGQFYKFQKAHMNYIEKNLRKTAHILSPNYNLKLAVVSKDNSAMVTLFSLYQLNNLGCIAHA
jgi:hypothetical protein